MVFFSSFFSSLFFSIPSKMTRVDVAHESQEFVLRYKKPCFVCWTPKWNLWIIIWIKRYEIDKNETSTMNDEQACWRLLFQHLLLFIPFFSVHMFFSFDPLIWLLLLLRSCLPCKMHIVRFGGGAFLNGRLYSLA